MCWLRWSWFWFEETSSGRCVENKWQRILLRGSQDLRRFQDSSGIDLTNIKQILCPRFTCVAVKADGSIVPWSEIEKEKEKENEFLFGERCRSIALRFQNLAFSGPGIQMTKCVILGILGTRASWASSRLGGRVWNLWNTVLLRRPHWWPWPSAHHCLGWQQKRWSNRLSRRVSPFIWCQEGLQPLRRLQEWCLHGRWRWGQAACLGRCSLWRFGPRGDEEIAKQAGRSRRDVLFVYTRRQTNIVWIHMNPCESMNLWKCEIMALTPDPHPDLISPVWLCVEHNLPHVPAMKRQQVRQHVLLHSPRAWRHVTSLVGAMVVPVHFFCVMVICTNKLLIICTNMYTFSYMCGRHYSCVEQRSVGTHGSSLALMVCHFQYSTYANMARYGPLSIFPGPSKAFIGISGRELTSALNKWNQMKYNYN